MGQAGVEWVPYFEFLVTACAVLVSVAFLALHVRADVWREDGYLHTVAVTALGQLASPVLFGLIFLSPTHPWHIAGLVVGGFGYAAVGVLVIASHRADAETTRRWHGLLGASAIVTSSVIAWLPSIEVKAYALLWTAFAGSLGMWLVLRPRRQPLPAPGGVPTRQIAVPHAARHVRGATGVDDPGARSRHSRT